MMTVINTNTAAINARHNDKVQSAMDGVSYSDGLLDGLNLCDQ
jgi:hypothetical protein